MLGKICLKQLSAAESSTACIASVSVYYGLNIPIQIIRRFAPLENEKVTYEKLVMAAQSVGFEVVELVNDEFYLRNMRKPLITTFGKDDEPHFVVVYDVSDSRVSLMDPKDGKIHEFPLDEFKQGCGPFLLQLKPSLFR